MGKLESSEKKVAAGIIAICTKTGRILLGKRGGDGSHPGEWAFFGGTFEESDLIPKETAKREFKEETKHVGNYKISSTPIDTHSTNFVTYYTYVGLFPDEFTPDVNGEDEFSQENSDYGWFPIDKLPSRTMKEVTGTIGRNYDFLFRIIASFK